MKKSKSDFLQNNNNTSEKVEVKKTGSKSKKKLKKKDEEKDDIDSLSKRYKNDPVYLSKLINSLFSKKIYSELYYAWCKDCNEQPSPESAKYFRDELLSRNNKDLKNFFFKSMRIGIHFLSAFGGNLPSIQLRKVDLQDNLINDECMHNIRNIISSKQVIHLNLASNQISVEGLKIIQQEIINSPHLKYLNFGVSEGSFKVNNFSGEGGIILARILLNNHSIETLILQENLLGEDAGEKIGSALIQNHTLKKLVISDNKIRNKGARSIIENGLSLVSLDLSDNEISPDICYDLKNLMMNSKCLKEIIWNGNYVGLKGINFFVDTFKKNSKLKSLSLRNSSIGKTGIQILAQGLMNNEYLQILDLGSNNIVFESFKYLCDSMNTNRVKIFRMRNNFLGDESAKYFSDNILSTSSNSCLTSFDFSSCKIYDQGLVYILNSLINNKNVFWINLRDNYFSHEIDFVILNFLEKNTTITHIDLTKNRFSFQCLQKVNKIIKRNRNIQNNKEPNKLLVELYSLKYENTKLNELKETLKNLENDIAELKRNKIDIRQSYELSKIKTNEEIDKTLKLIEINKQTLESKKSELMLKKNQFDAKKQENQEKIEELNKKYESLLIEKENALKENSEIKNNTEKIRIDLTKKIAELNLGIKQKETETKEVLNQLDSVKTKIKEVEEKIKEKEKEKKKEKEIEKEKDKDKDKEKEKSKRKISTENRKSEISEKNNISMKNNKIEEELKSANKIEGKENKITKKLYRSKTKKFGK